MATRGKTGRETKGEEDGDMEGVRQECRKPEMGHKVEVSGQEVVGGWWPMQY